jgi:multiple sugar transport system substrate-binding protein
MRRNAVLIVLFLLFVCCQSAFAADNQATITIAVQKHTSLDNLMKLIPEFEKNTGIKVVFDQSPQDQLSQKILLDLSVGSGAYDLIGIHEIWLAQYVVPGWLQSLDEYINNPKLTNSGLLALDDFVATFYKAFNYKGKQYGLPLYGEVHLLFYNKNLFRQAGLAERGPANLAELEQFAKQIKEKTGKPGIAMRGISDNRSIIYAWNIFAYGNGWDGWFDKSGNPQFNQQAAISAAIFYKDLLNNYGPKGIAGYNWPDVQTLMQQGEVGMIIDASNFGPRLEDPKLSKITGSIGYDLVPQGSVRRAPGALAYGLYLPKAAKNKEPAWTFLQWALSKETQLKTALMGSRDDVTRISVMNNPEFMNLYKRENFIQKKAESLVKYSIKHYPSIVPFSEVAQEVSVTLNSILIGSVDASKGLEELNKRISAIMKKSGS